jgi:pimeloyl-ACP methyl ester carboxylesterase
MRIQIEPDVHLFVDIDGAGLVPDGPAMCTKPTLVLLHGGPGFDHSGFKPAFSQLADVAQIVYYDHRGHGRSDARPRDEWTLDVFADDVVRLCDALGIVKPIVLGQSFGGFVAQRYIDRHPGHAAKVILSSTAAQLQLARKLAMFNTLGGPDARDAAQRFWTHPDPASFAAYWDRCRSLYSAVQPPNNDAALRSSFNADILCSWSGGELQTMDLLPGLTRAQCPVLVMAGARDPVCTIEDARDMVAALPLHLVQFAQFDDCGHGVWRDSPDAAFAVLRKFIAA